MSYLSVDVVVPFEVDPLSVTTAFPDPPPAANEFSPRLPILFIF